MIINVSEAKAKLSELIDRVFHGEKVVIAKNNLPMVDLIIHKPSGKRKLGLLKGELEIPPNFTDESAELNRDFYGDESHS